jgi:hypothetical protein
MNFGSFENSFLQKKTLKKVFLSHRLKLLGKFQRDKLLRMYHDVGGW